MTALGEIGLTGGVLPVSHLPLRLKEAWKMHMRTYILPAGNRKEAEAFFAAQDEPYQAVYAERIADALAVLKR